MSADLPHLVRVLSRFLPRADREWIVGDLLEAACHRGLTGTRRVVWLTGSCGALAAGLCATHIRGWLVLAPARELAVGVAIDARFAARGVRTATLLSGLALCGAVAAITVGVAILVAALLSACGLDAFVLR